VEKRDYESKQNSVGMSHDSTVSAHASVTKTMRTCPTCSCELQDNHCKLICENCGYFLSCS